MPLIQVTNSLRLEVCVYNNKNLERFGFFHTFYSIDKQMKPYTAKNSSEQTIRTKSVCFGHKNFVLCSADSYLYFIDPYYGAKYSGGKVSKIFVPNQLLIA